VPNPNPAAALRAMQAAHQNLFPIEYEDEFYHKAVNGLDR
jgi:hypothetical protein